MSIYETKMAILKGDYDDNIDELHDCLRNRRRAIQDTKANQNVVRMKAGDVVRITDIRPKYLAGAKATVKSVQMAGKITLLVSTNQIAGGKYRGREVIVPASCVEAF